MLIVYPKYASRQGAGVRLVRLTRLDVIELGAFRCWFGGLRASYLFNPHNTP